MFMPLSFIKTPAVETETARRCLFGSPDHDVLRASLAARFEDQLKAASERWNFDFKAEVPLSGGSFEWESPKPSSTPVNSVSPRPASPALDKRHQLNGCHRSVMKKRGAKRLSSEQHSNQTFINDFMPMKKSCLPTSASSKKPATSTS